jgi:hypothetical protein
VEAWAELHETELLADWNRLQEGRSPAPIEPLQWDARMSHPVYGVRSFDIVAPYTIRVRFDDDTEQTIDFQPVLAGELYGPLRDLDLFNQVKVDSEIETLVWPNGADFDPATLREWPVHERAFRELARRWESVQA